MLIVLRLPGYGHRGAEQQAKHKGNESFRGTHGFISSKNVQQAASLLVLQIFILSGSRAAT
jgi:hypothetical protein